MHLYATFDLIQLTLVEVDHYVLLFPYDINLLKLKRLFRLMLLVFIYLAQPRHCGGKRRAEGRKYSL